MNCAEFEQLIDSYLDGELSGSLRLEFDAHRLRCRRCQLTMVMMESIGSVVASDRPAAALSDDFTERVMETIETRRPWSVRFRPTRVAIVAGAVLQAAAVIGLAIWLPLKPAVEPVAPAENVGVAVVADRPEVTPDEGLRDRLASEYAVQDSRVARREALFDMIMAKVEEAGGVLVADLSDLPNLARYASALAVSEDVARASTRLGEANPWDGLLRALLPLEVEEPEAPPVAADQHSL